ncbi:sugar phosphate isomerase/epimerase [Pelagicoccus sp. SDUM812005]|uniref:sugar phosphate isomerase/epimerase family protein n=1 Tax=Pelagicoccus sp. SDUM812005 TaxID=3041257 RepID=UPI00280F026C|nr:sugar phosphate isomerase/epimerase [Pelagicoccus sp. SDUM812005]MDQ8180868.1 sugar phosphate isomerase/epimerase [Pelagicoccus sp. SDUM812005]
MSILNNLAVQSYCFREFKDNADVASKVRDIGLDKIEVCAVHANFDDVASWKEDIKIYDDAGISIVSIGVQTFTGNPDQESYFECAAAAGAKHISAHFQVGTFNQAISQVKSWSDKYGIKVGIHCHGGYMFGGQPDVLELLIGLGTPQIGLCMDTAWAMQIGPKDGKPIEWAQKYAGQLYGIHFKDFVFERNGQWKDTVVGDGNLDLKGLLAELERQQYSGVSILEYEADPENPVPALKECVEKMRSLA